jgi:hypothetical protein
MRCNNCGRKMRVVDTCIAGNSLVKIFRCDGGHWCTRKYSNFPSFTSLRRAWRGW